MNRFMGAALSSIVATVRSVTQGGGKSLNREPRALGIMLQ